MIENGFYYDFSRNEPFSPGRSAGDRKAHARDHRARQAVHQGGVAARRDQARFRDKGEVFKVELIDAIPDDQQIKIYRQGDWFDLCRGPHMPSTGKVGNAFKLMKVAGAYWRGDARNPMLTRIYGTAFASRRSSTPISSRSRRRKSATTAASAARWTCSISRRRRRARCSGTPRAGPCSRRWSTTSAAARTPPAMWR